MAQEAEFLKMLEKIQWFENSGKPTKKYHVVGSVSGAYDDWNQSMLRIWEPSIFQLEKDACERIGEARIDEIFSLVSAKIGDAVWGNWGVFLARQGLEEEMGLSFEILDMVKRDVSWACVERVLGIQGLFTLLLKIYQEGYFPCSWLGNYPEGRAVVM